jgi:hypothetical protein
MDNFLMYFMVCFLGYLVVSTLWQERKRIGMIAEIYAQSGPRQYLGAFGLALSVIVIAVTVYELVPEFMRFSVLQLFFEDSTGEAQSVLSKPLVDMQSEGTPVALKIALMLSYAMLLSIMPYIVWSEEMMFRAKRFTPWARLQASLIFGLSHMMIGIPLIVALVLAIPGYVFSGAYLRGFNAAIEPGISFEVADQQGVMSSTRLHTLYNASIITIVMAAAILLFVLQ